MSINIDKKKLRKALRVDLFSRSLPFITSPPLEYSYDGEWCYFTNPSGEFHTFLVEMAIEDLSALRSYAVLKFSDDNNVYVLFYEPYKGNYDNYQGFRHDGTNHCVESRSAGAETQTNLTGQDWTVEHTFLLQHKHDQSSMTFFIDGAQVAQHTTNISAQPYEIAAAEPNGVARTVYMKFPPGISPVYP